ncbi:protein DETOXIFICATION 33-like [Salvia miltiorrhiza]|uniref:protein DETOXIFICATION 33-like n=1 Tax=Salvia miltiorrhiza TaxID=226208 RepID=UPI0025AD5DCA|nr:protein DETOXIFICATION 33-like [Salvia miltiorrhiza]
MRPSPRRRSAWLESTVQRHECSSTDSEPRWREWRSLLLMPGDGSMVEVEVELAGYPWRRQSSEKKLREAAAVHGNSNKRWWMGCALETLCGQAVGGGRYEMLGIYMQRSCIITLVTALFLTPLYIFTSPILKLLRQKHEIADLAGKYAQWVIPQFFAYAVNFPVQKFLQAQSKIWVMTVISVAVLGFHVVLNWILITKLDKGLAGAAVAENVSWWLVVLAQVIYVVADFFPESWTGFSMSAFKSLLGFVKLSLASAVMLW